MSDLKIFIYPNLLSSENWGVTTDSVGVATTDHGLVTAANTDHEDFGLVTDTADSGTEGSLRFGDTLAESRAISYNLESKVITQEPEDYGSVADSVTATDNYGVLLDTLGFYGDYGTLVEINDPFGAIRLSGSATIETVQPQTHVGLGTITISGAATFDAITKVEEDKTLLGTLSGTGAESFIPQVYTGSGSFSKFGSKVERRGYSYNLGSIQVIESPEDYGSVADAVASSDDYGSYLNEPLNAYSDYGNIFSTQETLNPFGTISLSGSAEIETVQPQIHSGSGEITISGGGAATAFIEKVTFADNETLLGTFSGGEGDSYKKVYIGSGNIGVFSGAAESISYVYSIDSIDVFGGYEDYGLITDSPSYEDLGSITTPVVYDDLGIVQSAPVYPYGEISIDGALSDERRTYSHYSLPLVSGITTAGAFDTNYIDQTSFDDVIISNGGSGTGSLGGFNIGPHLRFGYTVSTPIVGTSSRSFVIRNIDGLTQISFNAIRGNGINGGETPDLNEDLKLYYSIDNGETYYFIQNIINRLDTSFNTLKWVTIDVPPPVSQIANSTLKVEQSTSSGWNFDHYGISEISFNFGSRGIRISGEASAVEKVTAADDETVLGTFTGTGAEAFVPQTYTGSGSFSAFGSKAESRGYSYGLGSIQVIDSPEDYGSVADAVSSSEDYGSYIGAGLTSYADYGDIFSTQETLIPFGSIVISGTAEVETVQPQIHNGTGGINVSGAATFEKITFADDETLLGTFSGGNQYSDVNVYVGSGNIGIFSGAAESTSYVYSIDSIDVFDGYENYGLITDSPSYEDLGLITTPLIYDDLGYIAHGQTVRPYGTVVISGAISDEQRSFSHEASGEITISGEASAVEKVTAADDETLLGTFSGTGAESFQPTSYVGSGSFSAFGSKAESRGYSYGLGSIQVIDSPEDYGSVSDSVGSSEDYGSYLGAGLNSYADYGDIFSIQESLIPFGTIRISGTAEVETVQPQVHFGSGEIAISGAATFEAITKVEEDKTLLGTFTGGEGDSYTKDYIGSGNIGVFSGASESTSYVYSIDSIDVFGGYEDYGSIASSVTYEDLGSITTPVIYDDLGIVQSAPVYPYGTAVISGAISDEQRSFSHEASGEITISGLASVVEKVTAADDETLLGTFSGTGAESFQPTSYVGSGSFSAFGSKAESRGYSYNLGSIQVIETPEDYGSVADAVSSSEDYGSYIGAGLTSYDDYGNLFSTQDTLTPFGSIVISGTAEVETVQPQVHFGSGEIVISGAATFEAITKVEEDKTLLGTFSGGNQYAEISSYVGSGNIGVFSGASESRTYDYNIDSILFGGTTRDYGSVGVAATTSLDYGILSLSTTSPTQDYGYIVGGGYPYGTIVISGAISEQGSFSHEASGEIVISGEASAVEKVTAADDETLLGTFSGTGAESFQEGVYTGSGSFSKFGSKVESRGYSYNLGSIQVIDSPEDYGSVADSVTSSDDYGSYIGAGLTSYVDHGNLFSTQETLTPYGTIRISGASSVETIQPEVYSGIGTITISGAATFEAITKVEEDKTLLGTFSGGNQYAEISSYVGSGAIGIFSGASESRTYDYNLESIDVFGGYEDYGLITDSPSYEDLGSITTPVVYDDLGIVQSAPVYPYGEIIISGGFTNPQLTFAHEATGQITISGEASAVEKVTAADDETLLGTFSGTGAEAFVPQVYTGSGEFSAFGSKAESRGYSYGIESIVIVDSPEDYGSVADAVSSSEDYGSYIGAGLTSYADYGSLFLTPETTQPFGTIIISGGITDEQVIFAHEGSGTIGIFSGTAEVVGWNPPDQTVDITISGQAQTAVEAEYTPDPGIGTIFIDGTLVERRTYSYNIDSTSLTFESQDNGLISDSPDVAEIEGGSIASLPTEDGIDYGVLTIDATRLPYGTIRISGGFTNPQLTFAHEGSGTIGIFSGTADSVGWNPPDQTVDVTISGDALTAVEADYTEVGIGTVNVSGFATDERRSFSHVGSGQIDIGLFAEVTSNIPSPTGGVIELFGRAGEVFAPTSYIGSGTISASDNGLESRTYVYNETSINALISEDNGFIIDPATYEDRGVLSDIVIYEDYGYVFDDGIQYPFDGLIEISGSASVRVDSESIYEGSGSIGIGGTANPVFYTPNYPGIGTITISGSAQEAKTPATYIGVGTGQFSSIAGSAEVVGWNPPDRTVDITISGVGSERFSTLQTYSGVGTISIGGTASPVFFNPAYIGSGTIDISGIATSHYVPNYPGIGTIFAITGAAEAYGAKPPIVPSDIIITGIGSEAYAPAGYTGIGTIVISGAGIGVSNPYRAPFVFVTII